MNWSEAGETGDPRKSTLAKYHAAFAATAAARRRTQA